MQPNELSLHTVQPSERTLAMKQHSLSCIVCSSARSRRGQAGLLCGPAGSNAAALLELAVPWAAPIMQPLSLSPQASAGRLLYDTAGGDAAALLEGSRLCCTRQLRDLLPCLGGVAVLLPLLEQLGADKQGFQG